MSYTQDWHPLSTPLTATASCASRDAASDESGFALQGAAYIVSLVRCRLANTNDRLVPHDLETANLVIGRQAIGSAGRFARCSRCSSDRKAPREVGNPEQGTRREGSNSGFAPGPEGERKVPRKAL